MSTSLAKLPLEALEIRRLSWYGLAFLHQRACDRAGPDTPEGQTYAAEVDAAVAEAEACEAEIERRRSKRKGKARTAEASERIACPEQNEELPLESPNVIAGPWAGSHLRR